MEEHHGSTGEYVQITKEIPSDISSLEISPAFLERIKNASTPTERQTISDGIFNEERREKMLADASRDRHGRPVRYYRRIKLPKVYQMLEHGSQTAYDYFDELDTPITEKRDLARRLGELAKFQRFINDDERFDVWGKLPLEEVIRKFKQLEPSLPFLPESPTHRNVLQFMEQMPLRYVARIHSGGLHQKFSPYLSLSVGGPIQDKLYPDIPVVEFILPDDQIYLQPDWTEQEAQYGLDGVNGEKEVYAKTLPLTSVSTIYFDPLKYRRDFINSSSAPPAKYREFNEYNPIEGWRWNTTIFDYLPANVAEQALAEYGKRP